MRRFKDFSITRKLLTGFLGMSFIMLIVGGVGTAGMIRMNQMDTRLYEKQTAPIVHLINAIESLYQIRMDAYQAVINSGDLQKIAEHEKSYLSSKEAFLSESATYRDTITSDASFLLFDEAADIFVNDFDPVIQKTFELAKAGDQAGADAAELAAADKIQTLFQNYNGLTGNRMNSAKQTSDTNNSTAVGLTIVLSVLVVFGAGMAVLLGLWIARVISKPIGQVVDAANRIALGHVNLDLKDIDSKDETGQLAAAFDTMLDSIRKQVLVAESISNGDFTQAVPLRSNEDILGLALQKIENDLNQTLLMISTAADQVNSGAGQVSSASQALASGAAEQAATVEELTASVTSVSQQAEENAASVRKATEYVAQAGAGVDEGNVHMQSLNTAMNEISESSVKISEITKVIEDIAFQTNILALNAAIEAARAGAAGKGFAVVADEVRNLAAKSAEAAQQTSGLIQHSVVTVAEGEKLAVETAQILQGVAERAALVDQAVRQIELASSEQARAIEQITLGLSQVSSVVQTNAATAEESSASSEELAAQAQTLRQEVGKFKLAGGSARMEPEAGLPSDASARKSQTTLAVGNDPGKY